MKKAGLIIFILTLAAGVIVSNILSFGETSRSFVNFSINGKVAGSGKVATEQRAVSDFSGINTSGVFQVEVTAQKDFSVEIEADDNLLPLIKTEVSGGILTLGTEKAISSPNPIRVRISAPDIETLRVSGASKVSVNDLSNEKLQIDSSGASKISVAGETADLIVDVSGASKIDAQNLKSENAFVDASGASHVSLLAVNELRTDASGASKIVYSGSPANLIKKTSGASSVVEK
jgi:hypothetical protein